MRERLGRSRLPILVTLALLAFARGGDASPPAAATVVVDANRRHQTIVGWEASAQAGQDEPGFEHVGERLFDLAVDAVGVTRLRLAVPSGTETPPAGDPRWKPFAGRGERCLRYVTINDDDDPRTIDWRGFRFESLDDRVERVVLPMRRRLAARGGRLHLNLEYVAFIAQCSQPFDYVHADPEEYAELVLAVFLHLREKYDLVPDSLEILLEPDNVPGWDGERIGRAMVAAAGRLAEQGFRPEFVAPSTASTARAASYVDALVAVPGARELLTEISYHRYHDASRRALEEIATRATALGVRTAMLEKIGADVETLYEDLTVANVSAWQQFTLAFVGEDNGGKLLCINGEAVELCRRTRFLRRYFLHVRPGAVRIEATTNDRAVRALAFVEPAGRPVVVAHLRAPRRLALVRLGAGDYAATLTTEAAADVELGPLVVGADGRATLDVPAAGVLSIHPVPPR